MDCIIIGGNQMIRVTKVMKDGELLNYHSTTPYAQERFIEYVNEAKGDGVDIELVQEGDALGTSIDREIKESLEHYKPLKVAN